MQAHPGRFRNSGGGSLLPSSPGAGSALCKVKAQVAGAACQKPFSAAGRPRLAAPALRPAAPVTWVPSCAPRALAAVHPVAPCFSADHTSGPSGPCSMDSTPAELAFVSASGSHGPELDWMGRRDPGGLGDQAAGGVGVKADPTPLELS